MAGVPCGDDHSPEPPVKHALKRGQGLTEQSGVQAGRAACPGPHEVPGTRSFPHGETGQGVLALSVWFGERGPQSRPGRDRGQPARQPCLSREPPFPTAPPRRGREAALSGAASRGRQDYCTTWMERGRPGSASRAWGPQGGAQTCPHSHIHTGCACRGTPDGRATQAAHRGMLGWAREISWPAPRPRIRHVHKGGTCG